MHILIKNKLVFVTITCLVLLVACAEKKQVEKITDTPTLGTIHVSVDESFAPVLQAQIDMYQASNPGTKIIAHFKSEADCLKDFFKDSATRLVIVTRGLLPKEERYMMDSLGFNPGWNQVAADAVAIIVNKNSSDTLFTLERLQQQLTGNFNKAQTLVFDGLNKTSTVRFIEDSVLKGKAFDTSVVRAVKTSDDVVEYVATHENAIGFIGVNRIGNPEEPNQVAMLKKVKIAYVKCEVCDDKPYVMPSQETILNRRYPLVRGLYYIIKENYTGLGAGFVSFLKYERGQLIFRRSYLGPMMDFEVRNIKLNNELPKD
ncbi:PstS family phosphate ABC transporter substrate-binding protein [Ferruginibacter yonginensis]|uniref:PstS family phosphate ABC transporter substrate-binding protein n=1 Tax=Ferruginibacter yonginensis TaxID=1310416 RepID=A0ABV8QQ03_9BACT